MHVRRTKVTWLLIMLVALSVGVLLGWWYVHQDHGHDQHAGHDHKEHAGITTTTNMQARSRSTRRSRPWAAV